MKPLAGLAAVVALLLALAAPASAQQYTPDPVSPTPTTEAPPPAPQEGTASNSTPEPGEEVVIAQLSVDSSGNDEAPISLDDTLEAIIASGDSDRARVQPEAHLVTLADGRVGISVVIPPDTPTGIYLIAIRVIRADGTSFLMVVPVVVGSRTSSKVAAASVSSTSWNGLADAKRLPAGLRTALLSVDQAGGAKAVQRAVVHDGATINISQGRLMVSYRTVADGAGGLDSRTRPIAAAAVLGLAGAAAMFLRRRTVAMSSKGQK